MAEKKNSINFLNGTLSCAMFIAHPKNMQHTMVFVYWGREATARDCPVGL